MAGLVAGQLKKLEAAHTAVTAALVKLVVALTPPAVEPEKPAKE